VFSEGSLEDVNISKLRREDSSSSLSTDWKDHSDSSDVYLGQCVSLSAVVPPWLSATDCDPKAVRDSKLDAVYCRGISSHRSLAYQPAVYVNCCYRDDCYHFTPRCCVDCKLVSSTKVTDSPNIGRGVSCVLPTAARAALYFPASPSEEADDSNDPDSCSLLTQTANNNMPSGRSLCVHGGCKPSASGKIKMLAQ